MARTIGEAKALKMLDIPDFRHLTKEKAVQLVSMLDRVDPEVAKAVLEQYPKFAEVVLSTARDWKENVGKALEENGKVTKETIAAVSAAMASLSDLVGRADVAQPVVGLERRLPLLPGIQGFSSPPGLQDFCRTPSFAVERNRREHGCSAHVK